MKNEQYVAVSLFPSKICGRMDIAPKKPGFFSSRSLRSDEMRDKKRQTYKTKNRFFMCFYPSFFLNKPVSQGPEDLPEKCRFGPLSQGRRP
jgi:hypothetical protein